MTMDRKGKKRQLLLARIFESLNMYNTCTMYMFHKPHRSIACQFYFLLLLSSSPFTAEDKEDDDGEQEPYNKALMPGK